MSMSSSPGPTATTVLDGARYMAVVGVLVVGLGGDALWLWVAPPEGQVAVAAAAALACLAGLVLTPALARRRQATGRSRVLGSPGAVVVVGAVCAVVVEAVRSAAGLSGPWPQQALLALAVVAGAALWWGARGAISSSLVFVGLLVVPQVLGTTNRSLTVTAVTSVVAGVQLILVGLGLAVLTAVAARSARASDSATEARALALLELESARAAASAAAETQRSLHDTALNTLEAVARSRSEESQPAVVARCRRDIAVLTSAVTRGSPPDLPSALRSVAAEAAALGLEVDTALSPDVPWDTVPGEVGEAFVGAAREALGNVAKHSRAARAGLVAAPGAGGSVRVVVSDRGIGRAWAHGTDDVSGGFGIAQSIVRRMSDAGGRALIEDGPGGVGTVVTLVWAPTARDEPRREEATWPMSFARLVLLATWAVTLVSLATVAVVAESFTAPVPAVVAVLLPAAWVTVLALRVLAGNAIGITDVVTSGLVLVAASLLPVAADPYCSSVVGERGLPSARLILLVALLVWRPRVSTLVVAATSVVVASGLADWLWHQRWSDCGSQQVARGVAELAVVTLVWVGVRALGRRARELTRLEEEALVARLDLQRERARAAERRLWSDVLVTAAVDELSSVVRAGGAVDATMRRRAASLAGLLRALLAVGPAPEPLSTTLREWLSVLLGDVARAATPSVEVRGSVARLRPPPGVVDDVRSSLHRLGGLGPSSLVLVGWSEHVAQGLSVRAVAATTGWLPSPRHGDGWECDPAGEDDVTGDVTWTWTSPVVDAADQDSSSVASKPRPPVPSRLLGSNQPKEIR